MSFKMNGSHWQVLVAFMENHDSFAKGKFAGPTGKAIHRQLWERLSSELNALGFGSRSVEKWQKAWADIKYNVKEKAANNKKEAARTGGGPPKETPLSEWEMKILDILGTIFYQGVDSSECGVPQNDLQLVDDFQIDNTLDNELLDPNTFQVEQRFQPKVFIPEAPRETLMKYSRTSQGEQRVQPKVSISDGPRDTLLKYSSTSQVQRRGSSDTLGGTPKHITSSDTKVSHHDHDNLPKAKKRKTQAHFENISHNDHDYLPKAKKRKTKADFENEIFEETLSELKLIRQELRGVKETMVEISNTLKEFLTNSK